MTHTEDNKDQQNTGFIFGLTLGAAIGALSAILIHNNSEEKVVENFETKIKEFFQDIIHDGPSKKPESPKKIEYIAVKEEVVEPVVIKKKTVPKMFIKPKK